LSGRLPFLHNGRQQQAKPRPLKCDTANIISSARTPRLYWLLPFAAQEHISCIFYFPHNTHTHTSFRSRHTHRYFVFLLIVAGERDPPSSLYLFIGRAFYSRVKKPIKQKIINESNVWFKFIP